VASSGALAVLASGDVVALVLAVDLVLAVEAVASSGALASGAAVVLVLAVEAEPIAVLAFGDAVGLVLAIEAEPIAVLAFGDAVGLVLASRRSRSPCSPSATWWPSCALPGAVTRRRLTARGSYPMLPG
jgi:hypothetical protein